MGRASGTGWPLLVSLHLHAPAMSITTQRGDAGETELMFGRRVAKTHPEVAAFGEVDEFNAALGLARVFSTREPVTAALAARQAELIGLMGELATAPEDRDRYLPPATPGSPPKPPTP